MLGEIERDLGAGVAAAYHQHTLTSVGRSVLVQSGAYHRALEGLLAGQPFRIRHAREACGDHH